MSRAHESASNPPLPDRDAWSKWVRHHACEQEDPKLAVAESTAAGRAAWKLLLRLGPIRDDASILELGCGTGLVSAQLAPLASKVVAADTSPSHLDAAARRFAADGANNVVLHHLESDHAFPFDTETFDCVILSTRIHCTDDEWLGAASPSVRRLAPLTELVRVLKPGGQLFWRAENRFGYNRLKTRHDPHPNGTVHSYRAYRTLLGGAGFESPEFFEVVERRGSLHELRPLQRHKRWLQAPAGSFKKRLKMSTWLVPSFGISATRGARENATLLEELLTLAERELGGSLAVTRFRVSRKEKIVLNVTDGAREWILRVPLTAPARVSDANNASMLRKLEAHEVAKVVPKAVADGDFRDAHYYVESTVPGAPLARSLDRELGRGKRARVGALFDRVAALLRQLNPAGPRKAPFRGEIFEREVTERVDRLRSVIDDRSTRVRVREYFAATLYDEPLPFGVVHGDFSVQNLLMDDENVIRGFIDWEDGNEDGLLLIDAINFVESFYRHLSGRSVGAVIPELASAQFRSDVEDTFLRDLYSDYDVDWNLHEPLVYFKWLRHMAYLQEFWLRYDQAAIESMVVPVVSRIVEKTT